MYLRPRGIPIGQIRFSLDYGSGKKARKQQKVDLVIGLGAELLHQDASASHSRLARPRYQDYRVRNLAHQPTRPF